MITGRNSTKGDIAKNELSQFEKNKSKIEYTQDRIKDLKKWRNRFDLTSLIASVSQILASIIYTFVAQKNNSKGPIYFTIPEIIHRISKSWVGVLQALGQTCAFIGYSANGLRALWDLGITGYRYMFRNTVKEISASHPTDEKIILHTNPMLITRTIANVIIATFNIMAVVTVLGLLSTGIGLPLAAFAGCVGWVKDSVIPWWRMRKELTEAENELRIVNQAIQLDASKDKNELIKERDALQEQTLRLRQEKESSCNSMILGAISVIAFALFATGPFGLATLSMIGSVSLVALTFIGVGRLIYNACKRPQSTANAAQDNERLQTESEVEYRQQRKLNHWMGSTHQMMKAKILSSTPQPTLQENRSIALSATEIPAISMSHDNTSTGPQEKFCKRSGP